MRLETRKRVQTNEAKARVFANKRDFAFEGDFAKRKQTQNGHAPRMCQVHPEEEVCCFLKRSVHPDIVARPAFDCPRKSETQSSNGR